MDIIKEEFRVGDSVYLKDGIGMHTLEKNKPYIIAEIKSGYRSSTDLYISVEEDELGYDFNPIHFYNIKRFTKNIKPIRKEKLLKIWKNQ